MLEPPSYRGTTWIKPSFLWLMERSNWGLKSGQERILAVHIRREGWEAALELGVLTAFEPGAHGTPQQADAPARDVTRSGMMHLGFR